MRRVGKNCLYWKYCDGACSIFSKMHCFELFEFFIGSFCLTKDSKFNKLQNLLYLALSDKIIVAVLWTDGKHSVGKQLLEFCYIVVVENTKLKKLYFGPKFPLWDAGHSYWDTSFCTEHSYYGACMWAGHSLQDVATGFISSRVGLPACMVD